MIEMHIFYQSFEYFLPYYAKNKIYYFQGHELLMGRKQKIYLVYNQYFLIFEQGKYNNIVKYL